MSIITLWIKSCIHQHTILLLPSLAHYIDLILIGIKAYMGNMAVEESKSLCTFG